MADGEEKAQVSGPEGSTGADGAADDGLASGVEATAGTARCGYSRCRKPLPAGRTGRAREYCRESDTRWPVDGRTVTCRELGRAERLLTAVHGQPPTAGAAELVDLQADLAALRAPATELRPLLEAATAALTRADEHIGTVESQLDERVTRAEAERDAAQRESAEARGRAIAAEAAQIEAEDAQCGAERDRDAAEAGQERARRDAAEARREQARAEGERDRALEQATELDGRLAAVTEARDTAQRDLAATQARLAATDATLEQVRAELTEARAEADQARGAHQRELEERHNRHAGEIRELESTHATALHQAAEKRAAAVDTARREERGIAEQAREQADQEHAAQLAELHTRLGAEQAHRADAEHTREQAAEQIRHWHRELSAALDESGENHQELTACVQRLLAGADSNPT